jgi:hypothetical protein
VNFIVNTCEVVPQEDVLASLRLFAAEVLPKFRPSGTWGGAGHPGG